MNTTARRRGLLIVLSSPSGAGKSSLAKALLDSDPFTQISISATTRPKRPAEVDGMHYHFVDEATFMTKKNRGDFLETVQMYGHFYGTLRQPVLDALAQGRDIIFDIDSIGTRQIATSLRKDLVSVFILPPSVEELERRLRTRSQDSEAAMRTRLSNAANEMGYWPEYDYVIINHDLQDSLKTLRQIVDGERLRRFRQETHLTPFAQTLIEKCNSF